LNSTPTFAQKYGAPGETDRDGFDPYADSVGAGIYGGVVKRRPEDGSVVIGKQYQGHNPRPGPVYAGGGYTPVSDAIATFNREVSGGVPTPETTLAKLLDAHPDLVNDVSTGGASPLHTCGMSRANQHATAFLISRGADVDASNNLAIAAEALLKRGADPDANGPPRDVATQSEARDVLKALDARAKEGGRVDSGASRTLVPIRPRWCGELRS
jgi:ankyrin repeat protein